MAAGSQNRKTGLEVPSTFRLNANRTISAGSGGPTSVGSTKTTNNNVGDTPSAKSGITSPRRKGKSTVEGKEEGKRRRTDEGEGKGYHGVEIPVVKTTEGSVLSSSPPFKLQAESLRVKNEKRKNIPAFPEGSDTSSSDKIDEDHAIKGTPARILRQLVQEVHESQHHTLHEPQSSDRSEEASTEEEKKVTIIKSLELSLMVLLGRTSIYHLSKMRIMTMLSRVQTMVLICLLWVTISYSSFKNCSQLSGLPFLMKNNRSLCLIFKAV